MGMDIFSLNYRIFVKWFK